MGDTRPRPHAVVPHIGFCERGVFRSVLPFSYYCLCLIRFPPYWDFSILCTRPIFPFDAHLFSFTHVLSTHFCLRHSSEPESRELIHRRPKIFLQMLSHLSPSTPRPSPTPALSLALPPPATRRPRPSLSRPPRVPRPSLPAPSRLPPPRPPLPARPASPA